MSAARGVSSVSQEPVRTQRPPIQCLDRRFPDRQTLIEELAAWADCRSKKHTRADWLRARVFLNRRELTEWRAGKPAFNFRPASRSQLGFSCRQQ
jgi:hypothetical protein